MKITHVELVLSYLFVVYIEQEILVGQDDI